MAYEFSWFWFMIGMIIMACGAALVVWYQPVADNFGGGVGSYERYRLWGLIAVIGGFLVMLNIHTVFLGWAVSLVFGGLSS
jgi:hypothetical protein